MIFLLCIAIYFDLTVEIASRVPAKLSAIQQKKPSEENSPLGTLEFQMFQ
jgi:hypothetical protein